MEQLVIALGSPEASETPAIHPVLTRQLRGTTVCQTELDISIRASGKQVFNQAINNTTASGGSDNVGRTSFVVVVVFFIYLNESLCTYTHIHVYICTCIYLFNTIIESSFTHSRLIHLNFPMSTLTEHVFDETTESLLGITCLTWIRASVSPWTVCGAVWWWWLMERYTMSQRSWLGFC